MKLAAYYRVSTHEQADEGVSLKAQAERIKSWGAAMGHTIEMEFGDPGVSGGVPPMKRLGFKAAVDALERRKIDGLVGLSLDRFSRSVPDILAMVEKFNARDWHIISMRESLDTATATGKFTVTILAAVSELGRGIIGENTREGLAQVRREGRRYSRHVPFGKMLMTDGKLETCVAEMKFVEAAISLTNQGMEQYDIAAWLNEHLGPHPRMNAPWDTRRVTNLVRSAVRLGAMKRRSRGG